MKRRCSVFACSVILSLCSALPALAAGSSERYTPPMPPFYSGGTVTTFYDTKATAAVEQFFKDYDTRPHVALVAQQMPGSYGGSGGLGKTHRWVLIFVKLPANATTTSFGSFVYYDPLKYPDRESTPLDLSWGGSSYFDTVS